MMKYILSLVLGKVRDNNDILCVSKTVSNRNCVNINVNRRDHEPLLTDLFVFTKLNIMQIIIVNVN